jgi:predicted anti-sigma-YlaC factor YlaD
LLTCKDFLTELNEFFDENQDPQIRQKVQEHIDECPNCWVIFDTTKKTIQIYKGMEPQTIPQDVESRLLEALHRRCGHHKHDSQSQSQARQ